MNKKDYMTILSRELGTYTYQDVQEIVDEIGGHFDIGISNGKTEEQICEELGDPVDMAKAYKQDSTTNLGDILRKKNPQAAPAKEKDTTGGILFVVFFNIFIGAGLWIWLAAMVLGLIGLDIAGIVAFISGIIAVSLAGAAMGTFMFGSIMILAAILFFTVFGIALAYFAVKYYIVLLIKYIKWNKKLCVEGF